MARFFKSILLFIGLSWYPARREERLATCLDNGAWWVQTQNISVSLALSHGFAVCQTTRYLEISNI